MSNAVARSGFSRTWLALLLCVGCAGSVAAQSADDFVSGSVQDQWDKWQGAMTVVLSRDAAAAETAFEELLALRPSAFRIALLAERTVQRTPEAGAVLLFEQDISADSLKESGKQVGELLLTGREQMNQADDAFYFSSIGRFDVAQANFRALLASNPDPVALLEFVERVPRRKELLVTTSDNPVTGESARAVLRLLSEGERRIKGDPHRIKENLDRLGGPPRAYENAVDALRDSGEFAVPFAIEYLKNPQKADLAEAILRALPLIDRPALNPLVMSLRMPDQSVKVYMIRVLAQIGYPQAAPHLKQLVEGKDTPPEIVTAANAALQELAAKGAEVIGRSAAESFLALAQDYYDNKKELAADTRLETANAWYWRNGILNNQEVPTAIFNEVMAMRCAEEALLANPDLKPALSLWLAANFRREAQLATDEVDLTRPANYPTAVYFAQSAGAEYCLMALARAVDDNDPVVALGAIDAVRNTGGAATVTGGTEGRQPLAEALAFPDRLVRIKAGLALGAAQPVQEFRNYQNLMPVLSEALRLHGGVRTAVVVDSSADAANPILAALRTDGYEAVHDARLFGGLEKVRKDLPGVDVIFIASDVTVPSLADSLRELRNDFRYASTPVVIVAKPGDRDAVRNLVRSDVRLASIAVGDGPETIQAAIARVSKAVGAHAITPELGRTLALDAARVLRGLGQTRNPLFEVAQAEASLLEALGDPDATVRLTVAETLGYIGSSGAQDAIANIALNANEAKELRIAMFAALAEAAKRKGAHLSGELTTRLIETVESETDTALREASSQALGALSLPSNPASQIVRNYYGG